MEEKSEVPVKEYHVQKDCWMFKKQSKKKKLLRDVFYLLAASVIYSISFHYFVSPSKFAPGGIGGVVAMVKHLIGVNSSTAGIDYSPLLIVLCNIPLLIPARKILSHEFAYKTFITTLLMTLILFIFDNFIDPSYKFSIMQVPVITEAEGGVGTRLISAIIGGALCGVTLAFSLKVNASTGGADIVGAILQKKNPHKSIAVMIFAVNSVILLISIFVYREQLLPVLLSIIYIYTSTKICDAILQGGKSGLKFEVITEHAQEISDEIIEKLGHGVTVCPAEGMFEHKNRSLLICIIKPRQIAKFQNIISKYPDTFAYVGQVNEIYGKFNKDTK